MAQHQRFQETGRRSFFGDDLYASYLKRHPHHFLIALDRLFDWGTYTEPFVELYEGQARRGVHPTTRC
jgi:hypothetical protein